MIENITLNIKYGDFKEMTLLFPEDIGVDEFLDNIVLVMKWLTYTDETIRDAFTGYYENEPKD